MIKFKYFSDRGILKRSGELVVDGPIECLRQFAYDLHRDHKLPGLPCGRWFGPFIVERGDLIEMCHTRPLSWVARDMNGQLKLFNKLPTFDKDDGEFHCADENTLVSWINEDMFREVRPGELRCVR